MEVNIWGTQSRRGDVSTVEVVLKRHGISDYQIEIFPESVGLGWEDNPVMITSLGSFAGIGEIRRVIPFLRRAARFDGSTIIVD